MEDRAFKIGDMVRFGDHVCEVIGYCSESVMKKTKNGNIEHYLFDGYKLKIVHKRTGTVHWAKVKESEITPVGELSETIYD